eukprot:6206690-Lingulodinium_polyedra.AAC.1
MAAIAANGAVFTAAPASATNKSAFGRPAAAPAAPWAGPPPTPAASEPTGANIVEPPGWGP